MINFSKDQIYIVTGASSGLGAATAQLLNERGATVIAIARNEQGLQSMRDSCKFPENVYIEIKDLCEDIAGLPGYVKTLKSKYGKFSGMAYCAGIMDIIPFKSINLNMLNEMFNINYFAPIMMVQGIVDKRNNIGKGTSIVAISSAAVSICDKGHSIYSGTKAALCSTLKSVAKELISSGIRVNCVLPTLIKTRILDEVTDEYIQSQQPLYPLGFGEPVDVANMIAFLLSNESKFISGQNYVIDSGLVL